MKTKQKPQIVGATRGKTKISYKVNYIQKSKKRKFDRALLPNPKNYFSEQFPKFRQRSKASWIQVTCCFHNDRNPSLSINLATGQFRCFTCNAKGCDVLAFHRLRYGLSFIEAATDLGAWSHE